MLEVVREASLEYGERPMRKNVRIPLCGLVLALSMNIPVLFAETVVLKSGQKVEGEIIEKTATYITVLVANGIETPYFLGEIAEIDGVPVSSPETEREEKKQAEAREYSNAQDIISRLLETYGGADKWKRIRGWTTRSRTELPPSGEIWETVIYARLPYKFRIDLKVNGPARPGEFRLIANKGVVKYYLDGKETGNMPARYKTQLDKTLRKLRRMRAPVQLRYFYENKKLMALAGRQEINGRECYVLEYDDGEGPKGRIFVDAGTFRSLKLEVDTNLNDQFKESFLGEKLAGDKGMTFPALRTVYNDKVPSSRTEILSVSFDLPENSLFKIK